MGSLQLLQAPAKYLQLFIEIVDDAKLEKIKRKFKVFFKIFSHTSMDYEYRISEALDKKVHLLFS